MPTLEIEQLPKVDAWLRSILWDAHLPGVGPSPTDDQKPEIYRLKAKLLFSNGDVKIVQGVREIFDILDAPKTDQGDNNIATTTIKGKIVLIGRELVGRQFEESFKSTVIT